MSRTGLEVLLLSLSDRVSLIRVHATDPIFLTNLVCRACTVNCFEKKKRFFPIDQIDPGKAWYSQKILQVTSQSFQSGFGIFRGQWDEKKKKDTSRYVGAYIAASTGTNRTLEIRDRLLTHQKL